MPERPGHVVHGASQRHLQLRETIPDRLDRLADDLSSCLEVLARTRLSKALQPDPARHQAVPGQLRDAATRIRWAAALIPALTTCAPVPAAGNPPGDCGDETRLDRDSGLGN
jgi:hypothetical protein